MIKIQVSPRYIGSVCASLLSPYLLVAGGLTGKLVPSRSPLIRPNWPLQRTSGRTSAKPVKFFSEAVQHSPRSIILQLHLANAQAHWCMQNPHDPDVRTRADAAEATLSNILRESPQNRLALWDLAMLDEFEGRRRDSQQILAVLLRDDPNDSEALTASGTITAIEIYFDIQNQKRKANLVLKSPARIGDEKVRKSLQSEFVPRIQATAAALDRASQIDPQSSQPLLMLNLLYRMEAELAATDQEWDALIRKADAFVDRAVTLNQQAELHPKTAQKKLSPLEPPPPLPGPPPPPPPPKPPGLQ